MQLGEERNDLFMSLGSVPEITGIGRDHLAPGQGSF